MLLYWVKLWKSLLQKTQLFHIETKSNITSFYLVMTTRWIEIKSGENPSSGHQCKWWCQLFLQQVEFFRGDFRTEPCLNWHWALPGFKTQISFQWIFSSPIMMLVWWPTREKAAISEKMQEKWRQENQKHYTFWKWRQALKLLLDRGTEENYPVPETRYPP